MNKEFESKRLNPSGIAKAGELALAFDALLENLKTMCPESREFSIAKTKLEEASFFAKKALCNNVDFQISARHAE